MLYLFKGVIQDQIRASKSGFRNGARQPQRGDQKIAGGFGNGGKGFVAGETGVGGMPLTPVFSIRTRTHR
jgi:hypothetical protein